MNRRRCSRVELGVLGVFVPKHVTSDFQDHVLEPPTRTEDRDILFPGISDRIEGAVRAAVRAPRRDQEAVEVFQPANAGRSDLVGADPLPHDDRTERGGGVDKRSVGGLMGFVGRVVVARHSYSQHAATTLTTPLVPNVPPLLGMPLQRSAARRGLQAKLWACREAI